MMHDLHRPRGIRKVLPAYVPDLPRLSPSMVTFWQTVCAAEIQGEIGLFGEAMRYRLCPAEDRPKGQGTQVRLRIDGKEMTGCFDSDLTQDIEELDEMRAVLTSLDPARLGLALEHLLQSEIAALEKLWNVRIELLSAQASRPVVTGRDTVGFVLSHEDGAEAFRLWISPEDPAALAQSLAEHHPERARRSCSDLNVSVAITGPVTTLPGSAIEALGDGDVLFPAQAWTKLDQELHLVLSGRHILPLIRGEGGVALAGPEADLRAIASGLKEGNRMSEQTSKGALSDPKVVVTIELERKELSVSELEGLQNGAVLPLDLENVEHVVLSADSVPVALGRLVQLEDRIGIQITQLV